MGQGENSGQRPFIWVVAEEECPKDRQDVWRGTERSRSTQDHPLKGSRVLEKCGHQCEIREGQ